MSWAVPLLSAFAAGVMRWASSTQILWQSALLAVAIPVIVLAERHAGRDVGRYLSKSSRTDCIYAVLHYTPLLFVLLGRPLSRALDGLVSAFAPFLRLNLLDGASIGVRAVAFVVAADLVYYFVHRLSHAVPFLWAFHSIHHSQVNLVPFTTWRLHFVDVLYVDLSVFLATLVLGSRASLWIWPPVALVVFGITFIEHSELNWRYGPLEKVVVSPHHHGLHHSVDPAHHDRNFAMVFSFWDYLFGTVATGRERPPAYGLTGSDIPESFTRQLAYPFLKLARDSRRTL
jgi:sterol desaturase/sphingolipid hydroxylase (fatty acid hydroxylase superfamily)